MTKNLFLNLPVRDVQRSIGFFRQLGYGFNAQFTNEKAACLVISEHINVMLVGEQLFAGFTPRAIADARVGTEMIAALAVDSRAEVDELMEKALAAGAASLMPVQDHGFMYQRGFEDPDGHLWEVFYMDPDYVQAN